MAQSDSDPVIKWKPQYTTEDINRIIANKLSRLSFPSMHLALLIANMLDASPQNRPTLSKVKQIMMTLKLTSYPHPVGKTINDGNNLSSNPRLY